MKNLRRKLGGRAQQERRPTAVPAAFPIVGVGASAGGLEAFTQLLSRIPPDSGMAFVFVQHLDPNHPSSLRERLAQATRMKVSVVANGMRVKPNEVFVIPSDADLSIKAGRLSLKARRRQDRPLHLPIDTFFQALAVERGSRAIGVVLSGTASDGTAGLRAIQAENGITFAQDPRTAKFGGMPHSAVEAGAVDHCLDIPRLAEELLRLGRHPYLGKIDWPTSDEAVLDKILALVDAVAGLNFAEYKPPTVLRRLQRRMALRGVERMASYLTLLEQEPDEVRDLCEDMLIHVTSMFRDPEAFAHLRRRVFPELLARRGAKVPVRIWVAGCSTGEEAYSLAICLLEYMQETGQPRPIQIFGSDASERAVEAARAGIYSDASLAELSDERRRGYFTKVDGGYRINKAVRELCLFVRHNIARDPPFSKLDLISCRNVLIYFDQALQRRVLPILHYCLNPGGFLLLGRTESISGFSQLFVPVDRVHKIFTRTATASRLRFAPRTEQHPALPATPVRGSAQGGRRALDVGRQVDRWLLGRYAPPGVVINDRMEIVQFRGRTGSYLQPAPGEPQTNLLKMTREGLVSAVRLSVAKAKKTMAPVRTEDVAVEQDGIVRRCSLLVAPLTGMPEADERLYLVLFEPVPEAGARDRRRKAGAHKPAPARAASSKLAQELSATREYLQSVIDEHGQTNDELAAANAELISGNEELQSMNEELETAKEELQSSNEELTTVNDELNSRNQELNVVNSDLVNLLDAVDVPILILDPQRRIRRFTPRARSILNVLPTDIGRGIGDITLNIDVPDLGQQIEGVVADGTLHESEVQDGEGRWYRMQIRPYLGSDQRIDGAILSLMDINALKHHISEAQRARAEAEQANRAKDQFLATLSHELRSPLATMLLHAQRLRTGHLDDNQLATAGQAIERGTRLQLQLIEDLLDVSRIASGKLMMQWKRVALADVIRAALDSVGAQAERRAIRFAVAMKGGAVGLVDGDPTRLQQVFWNLLSNAVKFSPQGGEVKVSLEETEGQARIQVSDAGVGIEPHFLPQVWQRFTQENSSNSREHTGLGLGLAIVRHLVEAHGGTVHADSAGRDLGATFSISLPLAAAIRRAVAAPAALGAEAPSAGGSSRGIVNRLRGVKVLVVDDDNGMRDAVMAVLSQNGAVVRGAPSAAAAMEALPEFQPEVLLSDIAMPGEDGYSLIRRVRALGPERGGDVPAIALTALAGDADRQQALSAGFQVHLSKPVDLGRLAEAIVGQVPMGQS